MVRINIVNPNVLSDQHLIAEYLEIMMLIGSVKNKKVKIDNIPDDYCLGKGHIKFFSNKLKYLRDRHSLLKNEMIKRGFSPRKEINLVGIDKKLISDWSPKEEDFKIISTRLIEKIENKKSWYRYYGIVRETEFFVKLLNRKI